MAVRFDADGEDYTRASSFGLGTFTVTCWAKIDVDRNAVSTAWSIDDAASSAVLLETNADGVSWEIVDTQSGTSSLFAATVGTWYFIAVTKDPNTSGTVAYWAAADAATLSNATSTHLESVTANTIRLGESINGAEWLNGSMAAVKIWSGVKLTQAEIENERFQYLPRRTANLHGFYPFLQGGAVAGAQQDFSGNGNTLSNGTNSATTDGPPIPWRQSTQQSGIPPEEVETVKGTDILDFGAFPGKSDTSVVITGQTGIVSGSLVEAWIRPADTADHSADEHMVDPPWVWAANIVAGTGFTIYGIARDGVPVPDAILRTSTDRGAGTVIPNQEHGREAPRPYGQWRVAWAWA